MARIELFLHKEWKKKDISKTSLKKKNVTKIYICICETEDLVFLFRFFFFFQMFVKLETKHSWNFNFFHRLKKQFEKKNKLQEKLFFSS